MALCCADSSKSSSELGTVSRRDGIFLPSLQTTVSSVHLHFPPCSGNWVYEACWENRSAHCCHIVDQDQNTHLTHAKYRNKTKRHSFTLELGHGEPMAEGTRFVCRPAEMPSKVFVSQLIRIPEIITGSILSSNI